MTIGARMVIGIALLGMALSGQLALDTWSAWQGAAEAERQQHLSEIGTQLLTASARLAVERGLTMGLLASPGTTTDVQRGDLAAQRQEGAAALNAALAQLPAADTEMLAASRAALAKVRQGVDQVLAGAGPAVVPAVWFAGATTTIEAIVALRRAVDGRGNSESAAALLIAVRDRLAEMAEFAGRERGMLNGLIASGQPAGPGQLLALGAIGGRVDGAWARVESRMAGAPSELVQAVGGGAKAWFDTLGPTRRAVLAAATGGKPWPVSATEWFAQASRAIDALLQAQTVASERIAITLVAERARHERTMLAAFCLQFFGLLTVAAIIWNLRARVVLPLRRAIQAILDLAAGELEKDLPLPRGRDEIAKLAGATLHFRETARQARAMGEAQNEMRAEADGARAEAVREIGDMIENVSEQAIEDVKLLTGQLNDLAQQVHAGSGSIAGSSQLAAADATAALGGAEQATGAARELTGAIREIAQQMERAADTTRVAVDRTQDAQDVFAALSASVAEIGEVASLITEIAGRTNLLALNATIEAARAGEAGRGFAVVAGEVKLLAQETGRSTARITQRIAAIDATTRQALAAVSGIAGSVSDLNIIAGAVAAAIEQQSAATAAIAEAVGQAGGAAERVASRMEGVAAETVGCEGAAGRMATISGEVASHVTELKGTLVRLMRSRVTDLDRRGAARINIKRRARLTHEHGEVAGQIVDISVSGARFVAASAEGWSTAGRLRLAVDGLPAQDVRVVKAQQQLVQFAFTYANPTEQEAMLEALDQLARQERIAA